MPIADRLKDMDMPTLRRLRMMANSALLSDSYAGALANEVYSERGILLTPKAFNEYTQAVIEALDQEIASRE